MLKAQQAYINALNEMGGDDDKMNGFNLNDSED